MILADQCVSWRTICYVRENGWRLDALEELAPITLLDSDVLQIATAHDLVLLTVDKDFANSLLHPPAQFGGIIVLRITGAREAAVHNVLRTVLREHERNFFRGKLVVVDATKFRVRA